MKVLMPQIGMTMVAGIIENWLVDDGDTVSKGDTILEISTEKLLNDVEAPCSGVIKILVEAGETVECGAEIAEIEEQ